MNPKKILTRILLAILGLTLFLMLGYTVARLLIPILSQPPSLLGLRNHQLSPCPDSPNCVSSQDDRADHYVEPLTYQTDAATARSILVELISDLPQATVVVDEPNYIRVETRSPLMGYIDDTEFYFEEDSPLIQLRAAARLGYGDMGANRARIERIRQAFAQAQN